MNTVNALSILENSNLNQQNCEVSRLTQDLSTLLHSKLDQTWWRVCVSADIDRDCASLHVTSVQKSRIFENVRALLGHSTVVIDYDALVKYRKCRIQWAHFLAIVARNHHQFLCELKVWIGKLAHEILKLNALQTPEAMQAILKANAGKPSVPSVPAVDVRPQITDAVSNALMSCLYQNGVDKPNDDVDRLAANMFALTISAHQNTASTSVRANNMKANASCDYRSKPKEKIELINNINALAGKGEIDFEDLTVSKPCRQEWAKLIAAVVAYLCLNTGDLERKTSNLVLKLRNHNRLQSLDAIEAILKQVADTNRLMSNVITSLNSYDDK